MYITAQGQIEVRKWSGETLELAYLDYIALQIRSTQTRWKCY